MCLWKPDLFGSYTECYGTSRVLVRRNVSSILGRNTITNVFVSGSFHLLVRILVQQEISYIHIRYWNGKLYMLDLLDCLSCHLDLRLWIFATSTFWHIRSRISCRSDCHFWVLVWFTKWIEKTAIFQNKIPLVLHPDSDCDINFFLLLNFCFRICKYWRRLPMDSSLD